MGGVIGGSMKAGGDEVGAAPGGGGGRGRGWCVCVRVR